MIPKSLNPHMLTSSDPQIHVRLLFDRRLVDKHDGDVVLDRIDALAGVALERGVVLHQFDGRLAVRTGEDLEQLRIDCHDGK